VLDNIIENTFCPQLQNSATLNATDIFPYIYKIFIDDKDLDSSLNSGTKHFD
jgi:hypothetical protein